jgi:hypothetical protein
MYRRQRVRPALYLLALWGILISTPQAPWRVSSAAAQTATGTIAYVRHDMGDEIRLIEPDGSNDRHLWAHGLNDPHDVYGIYNMAWRPDGRELAFASTHENWCSINYSDVFAVAWDGSTSRRITQAPACAALASYPRGTVRVPVRNSSIFSGSFTGFVYFQGAPSIQPVSLPPGGSAVVTFDNVADFGADSLQIAGLIDGAKREYNVGTAVDVQAGGVVTAGSIFITSLQNMGQEPRSPTWRSDSKLLGYAYGYAGLYGITPDPHPVEFGRRVVNPASGPSFVEYMAYGPVSKAAQILYQGYADGDGIYLVTEGSTDVGELLVTSEVGAFRGLAWLPDGSGFVYTVEEYENYEIARANLFEYSFATRQSKPLTSFDSEFAGQMSVSPDGQQIVFERSAAKEGGAPTDLWVVDRASSGLRLLMHNASAPAWSQGALPPPLAARAYLTFLRR